MAIHKKPSVVRPPHPGYIYEISEFDKNAKHLIGWPGYRTSQNKSGLGYIETRAELAHMQGLFLKWLVTGKFRTHNPFFLLVMIVAGTFYGVLPLIFIIQEIAVSGNWSRLLLLVYPPIAIGILLFVNVVLSIIDWNGKSITGD